MVQYNPNDFQPASGKEINSSGNVVTPADGINSDGSENVVSIGKYQDLGQVITGTNMTTGTIIYSATISNAQWVRNIVLLTQSDQQYDIGIQKIDSSGIADFITWISTNLSATGTSSWRTLTFIGVNGILGASAKIVLKNSSASANTVGNVRVQLMGL